MNLAVISGTLGPIKNENIFTRNDGVTVVDGYIKKYYTIKGNVKDSLFYYTISGSKADQFLRDYREGDNVILTGKLVSRMDEDGRYWFTINCTNLARLDSSDEEI